MLRGTSPRKQRSRVRSFVGVLICATCLSGCSRQFWRKQADVDTYSAIGEKLNDPHWSLPRVSITPDPRSRFYDPFDPDKRPLPPDDPAAHEVMHSVSGRKGYQGWHKLGVSFAIENPQWLQSYGVDPESADPVTGHTKLQLTGVGIPEAVELAAIHSREYQTQIELLYTSALSLTEERFNLGARYLVGGGPPVVNAGINSNRNGEGSASLSTPLGIRQTLPGGAQIAADVANTVTWVFSGDGSQTSAPGIGYSLTQPLLYRAGRKIVLENLTQAERNVLYRVRSLARYRQTLFANISQNYLNLLRSKQNILNTRNNIRQLEEQLESAEVREKSVPGEVNAALEGFAGLEIPESLQNQLSYDGTWLKWRGSLSADQEVELLAISEDADFKAAASQLLDFKKQQTTSLNFLQLKNQLNDTLSGLASSRTSLEDQYDQFKIALGLPPDIQLELNEDLLRPFELISWDLIELEEDLKRVQKEQGMDLLPQQLGNVGVAPEVSTVQNYVSSLIVIHDAMQQVGIDQIRRDFAPIKELLDATADDYSNWSPGRRYFRSEEERTELAARIENDERLFRQAEREFRVGGILLEMLKSLLDHDSKEDLLQALDKDGSGQIDQSELPRRWSELPKGLNASDARSYSVDELLIVCASGARDLRDKYLLRMAQSLEVLQASLRVEQIALSPFTLDGSMRIPDIEEVVSLALEYRHDLMNARAEVMDARRDVEIAANALEAGLDVTFSGRQGLNPDARGQTGHGASLRFTTPIDQISERNSYRRAQIAFQQVRREYMATEDSVKQSVRRSWRQLQVLEYRLLIDRTSVRNAALTYDNASLAAQGGGGGGNGFNLTNALSSVLRAQNSLAQNWVAYETNRLNIFRDMGIMEVDARGMWNDPFYVRLQPAEGVDSDLPSIPPTIPDIPESTEGSDPSGEGADAAASDVTDPSSN